MYVSLIAKFPQQVIDWFECFGSTQKGNHTASHHPNIISKAEVGVVRPSKELWWTVILIREIIEKRLVRTTFQASPKSAELELGRIGVHKVNVAGYDVHVRDVFQM